MRTEDGVDLLCSPRNPKSVGGGGGAPDKVEVTKTLLRNYGFTDTQISILYTAQPGVFTSVPEKTLLPKLEFFRGVGLSNAELSKIACSNLYLLTSSLQNQIVPAYNFIKSLLLSDSSHHKDVVKIIERSPRLLTYSLEERLAPNIAALREAGVPHSRILYLLGDHSVLGSSSLGESIKKATEMGFNPNKLTFVDAVKVFTSIPKPTLDKKMEIFRRCGMSDEEILMAFTSFPIFMLLSEENVVQTMDFIVKKMGWLPADLARNPNVLGLRLEKRIIPRCTVVRYLQGKGLVSKRIAFPTFLHIKEKDFVDKFVHEYENDVPGLMDIYLGKTSPQEPIP